MDFDEWMNKNYSGAFDMPHQREAYEAGQQSKQAEIEHRTRVSVELAGELIRKRAEIDELQKRIDEAKEEINSFFDNQTQKPTGREYCNKLADILEILK